MSNHAANIIVADSKNKLSGKEIFFKYLVYLPLFIVSLGISVTIAYLYIRYKVPTYNSSISLLIKDNSRSGTAGDDMMLEDVMLYKKKSNLANEIEVLKSVNIMERVVRSLGLNVVYHSQGKVKLSELYGSTPIKADFTSIADSTTSYDFTVEKEKGAIVALVENKKYIIENGQKINFKKGSVQLQLDKNSIVPGYKYYIKWLPPRTTAESLAGSLKVSQLNRDASIININIQTEVPQKGRDVLDKLVTEYRQLNIDDKNKVVDNTIRFIDERLDLLTSELSKVEGGKQDFQQRNNVINIDDQSEASLSEVNLTKDKIEQQEVMMSIINMLKNYLSDPSKKFEIVPSSLGIQDLTLNGLINSYNDLQLKREADLKTIPAAHPSIVVLNNQIEKLRTSIIENLNNIHNTTASVTNHLRRGYNSMLSTLKTVPGKERELKEIMRQAGIKEKLYLFLLQKREESAITRASAVGSSSVLDPAVSGGQVSPDTTNIYRIALVLGLLLPVALVYLRDLLNDKIITRNDLTKATQTPIIGEVAHHASMTRKFVVGLKDRSILAEQFRIIRTNLQFLLANAPSKNPVILVTSSIAGEGKTFCSMNMAAVWAVAGKKTVILELDLRKPKISKALSLQREIGISNYVLGSVKMEELPQPLVDLPNLYVIGAGPIPPNPSEMIMDSKMDDLFMYLRANFDMIIIDSAPVGLVSDSKILARLADATLYVIRQRYTVKKQITFIDDMHIQKTLPNMGLIVNDVKIGGVNSYYGYGYGYGYGYSYNYSYNYSYGQEKKGVVKRIRNFIGV